MKKLLVFIVILLAAFSVYWYMLRTKKGPKVDTTEKPMAQKRHSENFNKSIDAVVAEYMAVRNAFAAADTAAVKTKINSFIRLLDAVDMKELEKDSGAIVQTAQGSMMDIKSNAVSLLSQADITEMRRDFKAMNQAIYPAFFKSINYEGKTLYLYNCATAFNGSEEAEWLSDDTTGLNPYLGKGQFCGEVKDSVMAAK